MSGLAASLDALWSEHRLEPSSNFENKKYFGTRFSGIPLITIDTVRRLSHANVDVDDDHVGVMLGSGMLT